MPHGVNGVRGLDGHTFVKSVLRPHAKLCKMPMDGESRCCIGIDVDMENVATLNQLE